MTHYKWTMGWVMNEPLPWQNISRRCLHRRVSALLPTTTKVRRLCPMNRIGRKEINFCWDTGEVKYCEENYNNRPKKKKNWILISWLINRCLSTIKANRVKKNVYKISGAVCFFSRSVKRKGCKVLRGVESMNRLNCWERFDIK